MVLHLCEMPSSPPKRPPTSGWFLCSLSKQLWLNLRPVTRDELGSLGRCNEKELRSGTTFAASTRSHRAGGVCQLRRSQTVIANLGGRLASVRVVKDGSSGIIDIYIYIFTAALVGRHPTGKIGFLRQPVILSDFREVGEVVGNYIDSISISHSFRCSFWTLAWFWGP